jgi:undecaprenyl-diphosphatase
VVSGAVVARPWTQWRTSLEEGLRQAAIGTTVVFSFLWTLARPADESLSGTVLAGVGLLAVVSGVWLRRHTWADDRPAPEQVRETASRLLIAYGLACMTTAPLVIAAAGFACVTYWLAQMNEDPFAEPPSRTRRMVTEVAVLATLLLALSILFQARGVLPFQ